MSDAIADAPVRANRATTAESATPSADPAPAPASTGQELDERTVAKVAVHLLRGLIESDDADDSADPFSAYGILLVHKARKELTGFIENLPGADASNAFHVAAAMLAGATAYDRETRPTRLDRHQKLDEVFRVLSSADESYHFEQAPCEALAAGIQAGAKQFREQPRPPIRRVESDSLQGVHRYSHKQLQTAMEVVAGQMATLDQMLIFLQCRGEDDAAPMLLDSAQAMASHIGGMVDTLCGEAIRGGMERWQFGPSFADEGKAGAA